MLLSGGFEICNFEVGMSMGVFCGVCSSRGDVEEVVVCGLVFVFIKVWFFFCRCRGYVDGWRSCIEGRVGVVVVILIYS